MIKQLVQIRTAPCKQLLCGKTAVAFSKVKRNTLKQGRKVGKVPLAKLVIPQRFGIVNDLLRFF